MKTRKDGRNTRRTHKSIGFLLAIGLVFGTFFGLQGCGLQIAATKDELKAGDSLFLRGFGGKTDSYEWSVTSSDTLSSLKITFGDDKSREKDEKGNIKSCSKKAFCAIQRGKDSPSGTLLITLQGTKDGKQEEVKFVLSLPSSSVQSSEESTTTDSGGKPEPTQPDAGTTD